MAHNEKKIDFDVIIIGAGISGVCFAYRLQQQHPNLRYCILESRNEVGGTWSFFKYPGLRSDSDLYTFGFPWKLWSEPEAIAKGPAIVRYLQRTIIDANIDKNIIFNQKVERMSWSSSGRAWTIDVVDNGTAHNTLRSSFVMLATGYYDYNEALDTHIPGLSNFTGAIVHPQFWPDDLDYRDKNVVIIGSGATAITLLPAMATKTKHVTMLQRSPSYILSVPSQDRLESSIRRFLPQTLASKLIRLKWLVFPAMFRAYCTMFPNAARSYMQKLTSSELKEGEALNPNFTPTYAPLEQRMCMCPDGDFYECLRSGKASIKTDIIDTVTQDSIKLKSGDELHPDVIVTATGLKLRLGGGIDFFVDGNPYYINEHYVWKGLMFEDLPNLTFSFGYFDASWTLGVDTSAQLTCRLMREMQQEGVDMIIPKRNESDKRLMKDKKFLPLSSTYVQKALPALPKLGNRPQWQGRATYLWDMLMMRFCDIRTDLEWVRREALV